MIPNIGKDSDAGRDWGQEEKGTTEDEMAGWHHRVDGHESEWTPGVGDGQGGLVCCDSWGRKESDMTEWLNWTKLNWTYPFIDRAPKKCNTKECSNHCVTVLISHASQLFEADSFPSRPWCWERLKAGGEEGNRGWDGWMVSLTKWAWVWAKSTRDSKGQGSLACYSPWGSESWTWLSNWITTSKEKKKKKQPA